MKITRYRGDTDADVFTISKADGSGVANLTGSALKMTLDTLPNPPDSSTQVYQLTGVMETPTNGQVAFTPTEAEANQLGPFYYDIQLTDSDGRVRTIVKGVYEYIQDITK